MTDKEPGIFIKEQIAASKTIGKNPCTEVKLGLGHYQTHELLAEILRRRGFNPSEYTKAVGNLIDTWKQYETTSLVSIQFLSAMQHLIKIVD